MQYRFIINDISKNIATTWWVSASIWYCPNFLNTIVGALSTVNIPSNTCVKTSTNGHHRVFISTLFGCCFATLLAFPNQNISNVNKR